MESEALKFGSVDFALVNHATSPAPGATPPVVADQLASVLKSVPLLFQSRRASADESNVTPGVSPSWFLGFGSRASESMIRPGARLCPRANPAVTTTIATAAVNPALRDSFFISPF